MQWFLEVKELNDVHTGLFVNSVAGHVIRTESEEWL